MRAVRFHQTGRPEEVLRLDKVPDPVPGPGEVRVRLTHRSINPADLITVRGRYGAALDLPAVGGNEGAGFVDAVGEGVQRSIVGRRVVPLAAGPTWQEYLTARPEDLLAVPDGMDDRAAAQLFVNPLTAYLMLARELDLHAGDWVFQTGGATTVGRLVVQLARRMGVRTISLVRRAGQVEELTALGADLVLVEGADDVAARVREATNGAGVPAALDTVGGETGRLALDALGEEGTLLVYGALSGQPLPVDGARLLYRRATVRGFWRTRWFATTPRSESMPVLERLAALIAEGGLELPVAAEFDLAEIGAAVRATSAPGRVGKVLLTG